MRQKQAGCCLSLTEMALSLATPTTFSAEPQRCSITAPTNTYMCMMVMATSSPSPIAKTALRTKGQEKRLLPPGREKGAQPQLHQGCGFEACGVYERPWKIQQEKDLHGHRAGGLPFFL